MLAIAACGTGSSQSPDIHGPVACNSWQDYPEMTAQELASGGGEAGKGIAADPNAPDNIDQTTLRAVLQFSGSADPQALAFTDPGDNVHLSELRGTKMDNDGQVTLVVRIGNHGVRFAAANSTGSTGWQAIATRVVTEFRAGSPASKRWAAAPIC